MKLEDILGDLEKSTLDIDKLIGLDESQRNFVIHLFSEMMLEISNLYDYKRGLQPNTCKVSLIYRSLVESGYLVTRREKNLNELVD